MDEAQDTSELQGSLLDKVFSFSACDIRQRFGDSNQAIYDSGQQVATTDPFPAIGYKSLPNSQRFGANIAAKVHSLAPDPPSPALVGEGPCRGLPPGSLDLDAMRHTIFLFGPRSAHQVLPAFGSLLLQAFQDGALRNETFLARAIGLVGKSDTVDEKYPRHLGDYWGGYEPRAAKADPRPRYLADHVHLAQQRRAVTVDCAQCVKAVLKGICELIEIVRPAVIPRGEQRGRWLWEALRSNESSVVSMRHLIWEWCVEMAPIAHASWAEKVEALRLILLPVVGSDWNQTADKYCRWSVEDAMQTSDNSEDVGARNCYRFHKSGRHVDIDVGTIHSAKGQTHTATLVVESHYEEYDLQDLLPWLSGIKSGAGSKSKRGIIRPKRMRLIYTAMTRPSHLLCLALRADAIEGGGAGTVNRDRLENLGWNIQDLRVTGVAD